MLSSNIPGLDGNVLTGSLLPARIAFEDRLTPHWSILTAIGDGAVFINNANDEQAAAYVYDLAAHIRRSGLPGVIVLNLHPENVQRTRAMHVAALEVIRSGYLAWNLHDCLRWFGRRDRGPIPPSP